MTRSQSSEVDDVETLIEMYASTHLSPDSDQLARGRAALLSATGARQQGVASAGQRWHRPLRRSWTLAGAFALLLIAGGSLVAAESGPGGPLYGLRLAIGSLTLPADEPAHDRGLAALLDDRLTEVGQAARRGDGRGAQAAIDEYLHTFGELTRGEISDPAIFTLLQRHQDTLEELLSLVPQPAMGGVRQALEAADRVNRAVAPAESVIPHPTPPQGAHESPPGTGRP
jgi:hypothetical protein